MTDAIPRPTAFQIAGRSWRSLFSAAREMTPLFLVCLALLLLVGSRSLWIPGYAGWLTGGGGGGQLSVPRLLLNIAIADVAGVLVLAPLAVAVHRFILLSEDCNRLYFFNRTVLRFTLILLLFEAVQLFGAGLQVMGAPRAAMVLYNLIYGIAACWTFLIFPAIALGEKQDLFNTATERAQGNFWLIVRSLFSTVFLLGLTLSLLTIAYSFLLTKMLAAGISQSVLSACYMLVTNSFKIAIVALAAAVASHLYSYAAQRVKDAEAGA